jgi:hypothetical protein
MADEWDRQLIPEFFQTAFTLTLGASYKGVEMLKTPQDSAEAAVGEIMELFSVPEDAGDSLEDKAKGVVAVWMEKGAAWMQACEKAGTKFTQDCEED